MSLAPHDVPQAQQIIRRLCTLQSLVVHAKFPEFDEPNDCFCGESGFWPLDDPDRFRSSEQAVDFIESAVLEKLGYTAKLLPGHPE